MAAAVPPAFGQVPGVEITGGVTGVLLGTNDAQLTNDQTLSADLFIEKATSRGRWLVYIEGNSTLDRQGLSTVVVESNADSGTALDPDRNGRIQLSELNYQFRRGGERLTVGLIDASSFLDRSRVTIAAFTPPIRIRARQS
ncbi:MAG TPA: hypothetical protein VIV14_07225 [Gammaproteobacteria bacterium]